MTYAEDPLERARALAASGRAAEALALLEEHRGGQDDAEGLHFHAELRLALGQTSKAEEALLGALRLRPRDPTLLNDLGYAREARGDDEGALAAYRQAGDAIPPYPPALYNAASILARRGARDDAIDHLRRALASAPGFSAARLELARRLRETGEEEAAAGELDRLLAEEPNDAPASLARAEIEARRGEFSAALGHVERAIRAAPASADAHLERGRCLQELGRLEEALVAYRRAVTIDRSRYYEAAKRLVSAGRGTFWLRPSELRRRLLG